ncbi:sigma-54-dependent Fis family transcriptional regulator [Sinimarinibacterium sp. CAU 1509]|uniref:sigma-54-dependent transcriptional regulator n=1 Tax=Sinimarinibacterium sp. CAU 1509 TaxID=2562283 RepID=UPI0010AB9827|nr:sigma-54 dependent transcriptional regulator [Sinimarinibacterium sp. CAU 1509]TJY63027.1 sigma-54-dependent Fis family transcriptional regulator [Sinimarinibacterium sp. CAU 1509]
MTTPSVLIVDDEADIRELIEITLTRMGLRTDAAATLSEARAKLTQQRYDVCITDMRLPDGNGISLVAYIQEHSPQTPVAVITAYGSAEAAVESLKAGAFDFVSKPVDVGMLRKLVDTALKLRGAEQPTDTAPQLLGEHQSVRQLRALIDRLSRSQAPVHISGESGTGKELVARLIHLRGPRASGPFVPVNCGAIPSELMESEFFGHLKGSFTGAHRDKAGLFQAAEGGTLFLDEVAELPLHMQVKLLRALQERTVRPVGAETELAVNVRIISATHSDLNALVEQGRFRQDLYYRLNVIEVRTPALRERPGDIPQLARHILVHLAQTLDLPEIPRLEDDAIDALQNYPFPGNVRELENILERAMTLCDNGHIHRSDLQLRSPSTAIAGHGLGQQIEDIERQAIRDALVKTRYNKTRAAELLGMSFRSLRYRIKKLGLDEE